ncbi:gag-aspartyl protease domain-containing protein [Tanacetum coccineum]
MRPVDSSSNRNDKHVNIKRKSMSSDDLTGSIAKKIGEEGANIGKHTTDNRANVAISLESVRIVHERLSNNVYGFFLGKCVAYPVVESYFSSKDGMDAMIENAPWLIHNVPLILKKWTPDANIMKEHVCNILVWEKFHDIPITVSSYARAMVELQANVELKDTLLVVVPNFLDEGYTMNEYLKKIVSDVLKNLKNLRRAVRGAQQVGLTKQEVRNFNPFDVLNTIENDDEMGTNEGNSKLVEKGVNPYVVSSIHETSYEAFGSPNNTHLATRINDLKRQMLDKKLVLVDDVEKPLKKVYDLVDAESDSEVDVVFNETLGFMTSRNFEFNKRCGVRNKSVYEQWKETYNENPYDDDDFDDFGLIDAQMKFANKFDISLLLFGHVLNECLKKIILDVLKNLKNPRRVVRGVQVGNSKLVKKGVNSYMVSSVHETSYEAFGSPNITHLATRINDLKRQMLEKKLVLVDEDEKLLKRLMIWLNTYIDSEVDEVFNETLGFMTSINFKVNKSSSGVRNKSLYEQWKETYNENPYNDDDFDYFGLIDAQMKFVNKFDISLLLFGHVLNECLKKIILDVLKNLKNPRRVVRGVQGFAAVLAVLVNGASQSRQHEHPSETMVFHNEDGNPARANIKQALGRPHKGVKASANSGVMYFFTSAQDGDKLQDDVRLCLGDDLKKAQDHNQKQV